jgi:hypothetical protein
MQGHWARCLLGSEGLCHDSVLPVLVIGAASGHSGLGLIRLPDGRRAVSSP